MKVTDHLSKEDIARFTSRSDFHGMLLLLANWGAIAAIFALVNAYLNPLTILLAIFLLGGRQLGLSVLMHECGHRSLFRTTWMNDMFGQWLCALPVMNDMPSYAKGHLNHHRKAGTREDPDLGNYQHYPISSTSFRRKIIRDLTGQTGFKLLRFIARGAAGVMSTQKRGSAKVFYQQLLVQLVLFLLLSLFGMSWAYLLWVAAYMSSFMLFIRLRQIAEHAGVPDLYDLDPRKNTRTVIAGWPERLFLAPNGVNYHMEHHFMASVPCYRLPALHDFLKAKHLLDEVPEVIGYRQVFRQLVVA